MAKYDELIASIKNYEAFIGEITYNEPLAQKTTFKVGGTAELFIKPQNYYSFQIALSNLLATNTPFFILGGGSNIVFPDGTLEKVVLSTQDFVSVDKLAVRDLPMDFTEKSIPKDKILITCFSGTPMASLVNYCTEHYISGVEQFAGLPGSVGGATFMNARCFDKSISDIIYYTTHMNLNKDKVELEHNRFDSSKWDYKKSPFQDGNKFITTVTFILDQKTAKDQPQIQADCKKYIAERVDKGHFKYPSAGSVFKNNHDFGKPSGKIIDEAGLKGYTIGGAKIADFHGNFIINFNKASAKDIKDLVEYTTKEVENKFGFKLEPEIIFVETN
ncbi:MAG: UDP-N-acetylmuramate dehydrogenase [Treponema sp.]|nr:UDP-N-acetylmuramate dehydrogenase [Treponema sp.]